MGRSVSTPRYSIFKTFIPFQVNEENDEDFDYDYEWECFVESLIYHLTNRYPSLETCNKWIEREDHVILENRHSYIGISEYCGLVSVWGVRKLDYANDYYRENGCLSEQWLNQVGRNIVGYLKSVGFDVYIKQGTFSNGVGDYFKA